MKNRERIPKEIVDKYTYTICFMANKDKCHMKVVELRTIWIMAMGYEFDAQTLEGYAQPGDFDCPLHQVCILARSSRFASI